MSDRKDKEIIELSDNLLLQEQFDVDEGWMSMRKRMRKDSFKTVSVYWFRNIAAILLLPLLIVTGYLCAELDTVENKQLGYIETIAVQGSRSRIELSDGSEVWLNAGSSLKYPKVFDGDKREVILKGEGYFIVNADPEHRFDVKTLDGVSVSAYGTEFNVLAYEKDEEIKVTLSKGAVTMNLQNSDMDTKLLPGEQAVYSRNSQQTSVLKVNPLVETAWKDGKIIFRKSSMKDVLEILSRQFNVEFKVLNKKILNYKFSATFTNESIEEILGLLAGTSPVSYKIIYPKRNKDDSYTQTKIYMNMMN